MEQEQTTQTVIPEVMGKLPEGAVEKIHNEETQLVKKVTALKITNEEAYREASEIGVRNRETIKQIKALRDTIVKPIKESAKNADAFFKKLLAPFERNELRIKEGMAKYLESRASKTKVAPKAMSQHQKQNTVAGRTQNVHTQSGRATGLERWVFEITDESKLDRKWMMPDTAKLGRAVRSGMFKEGQHKGFKVSKKKSVSFAGKA